jgi:nucleoside-diphosphate-sugar epimerase
MSTILITGTSGFLGSHLAKHFAKSHDVVCVSRKPTPIEGVIGYICDFTDKKTYSLLDKHKIDILIHMAATSADDDDICLRTNCLGTLNLCNYVYSRGCRKCLIASSIAAAGMQSVDFRPMAVPIPDEHPDTGKTGYGFTKYLMEQSLHYCARKYEDIDIIAFRIASILRGTAKITLQKPGPIPEWTVGHLAHLYAGDIVSAFDCALKAPHKPGCRVMNLAGKWASTAVPVVEILRSWFGDYCNSLDLSYYSRPGNEKASVFSIRKIKDEIGWEAETNPLI